MTDLELNPTAVYALLALAFAKALVKGDFEQAHSMLSTGARGASGADDLRNEYERMIDYGDGPPTDVDLITTMEDWPHRESSDLGWAYVAIAGDGYSEAVTVIVAQDHDRPEIRKIEWGRP